MGMKDFPEPVIPSEAGCRSLLVTRLNRDEPNPAERDGELKTLL